MKKILLIFAHPDDESFVTGGTIAKYVSSGWTVDLLCATKGEAGNTGPYQSGVNLAGIRQKELEDAAVILGISSISFLNYIDGTLSSLHPGELEDALFKKLTTYLPDIVITFEPRGISNHPDHTKICLSGTFAFQKYAKIVLHKEKLGRRDPHRFVEEEVEQSAEPKLYYGCMPESVSSFLLKKGVIPEESFGKPWRGTEDKHITTVIDISRFRNKKMRALRAHLSQEDDVNRFLSIQEQPLLQKEYYMLRMQGEHEVFMGNNDHVANGL